MGFSGLCFWNLEMRFDMEENRKKRTELLSPAGSLDILKAVVNAGADAVYCAGIKFGARAYANNFNQEELLSAIDYIHLREKKLYLTVNTLLKEKEMEEELYEYLLPFYTAGIDAVIVQDLGVMHFIREHFPKLSIHASTQMAITGAYGADMMLKAGCSRIVTARELSLVEIKDIYEKTGAEIESFVHGALCYSYSGQCLLSSMIGGRSGNRGRCAQPCRLPYKLEPENKSAYLLSPKDLCTIDLIPELISHGVHSFKIEGRMKQAEYAAGVTSIYRRYIDRYEKQPDQPYLVKEADRKKLLDLGNRCGFTDGYYKRHNGTGMMTLSKPSHEKGNEELQQQIRNSYIEQESKEKINGILILSKDIPARLVLKYKKVCVTVTGDMVQKAQKQPLTLETILGKMKKTGNTPFEFETLSVEMEPDVFVPAGALNQLRRKGLEELKEACFMPYRRNLPERIPKTPDHGAALDNGCSTEQLRVLAETKEQLSIVLKQPEVARVYLEWSMLKEGREAAELAELTADIQAKGKEAYLALPYIFRKTTAEWFKQYISQIAKTAIDGYLVRNLEEIGFLNKYDRKKKIQTDYGVYAYSGEACDMLQELGIFKTTMPVEYNQKELKCMGGRNRELIIYGRQPLMISAQCVHKNTAGCDRQKGIFYLKDRYGKVFPVKTNCRECYNILYNVNPLALFHHQNTIHKIAPEGIRFSFTTETGTETAAVFEIFRRVYQQRERPDEGNYIPDFTNGHFKRGVE